MPIRFTCSHCSRQLTVRDELAGKHGRCPYCKGVVVVPATRAVAPLRDPKKPDLESLALAALGLAGGEAKKTGETVVAGETVAAPAPTVGPIKMTCSWCDHEFEVEGTLAGKQTPCPECRRIVRVPVPQAQSPRDWRQMAQRPAAAALNQPRLEGEWGTATARSYVSAEALEEAEVLPVEREPLTPGQWALRIGLIISVLVIAYVGYRWYTSYRIESRRHFWLAEAQAALQNERVAPELAACVRLALMRYWQRTEVDTNRVRRVSRIARQEAGQALQAIRQLATQRDWSSQVLARDLLVEYLAQCSTAGLLPEDIQAGLQLLHRFPQHDALIRRVVQRITQLADSPEERNVALQRLLHNLAYQGSPALARSAENKGQANPPVEENPISESCLVALAECTTVGATEAVEGFRQRLETLRSKQLGQSGRATATLSLEPKLRSAFQLLRVGRQDGSPSVLEEIELLSRNGQLQDAWKRYEKQVAGVYGAVERWQALRLMVECALLHHEWSFLETLLKELDGIAPSLPPQWSTDVLT
ncbi:MAG: hypothetical protein RMJ19_11430, partial [Gemmatales bacterium]|nr:DUF4381 domain-containing protein [Gemmatales bacterium]MDW8176276.1 hypothetical protein [Gemmatales bacterium]